MKSSASVNSHDFRGDIKEKLNLHFRDLFVKSTLSTTRVKYLKTSVKNVNSLKSSCKISATRLKGQGTLALFPGNARSRRVRYCCVQNIDLIIKSYLERPQTIIKFLDPVRVVCNKAHYSHFWLSGNSMHLIIDIFVIFSISLYFKQTA